MTLVENQTGHKVKTFVTVVNNKTDLKVKILRSDNGGEYTSKAFASFCAAKGIIHQFTNPYSPEQNGIAERLNRTIIESARSMLLHASLPQQFWAEAVNTAVYLHNRSPRVALKDKTPYECWYGSKPNVSNLRVFGCLSFVHAPDGKRQKFHPKASKAIFVGYPQDTKGYKLYDLSSKRFVRSRNVIFYENNFHSFEQGNLRCDKNAVFHDFDENDEPIDTAVEPVALENIPEPAEKFQPVGATYEETFMRQVQSLGTERQRKPPQRFHPEGCFAVTESLTAEIDEPKSIKEAINGEHSVQWKEAMESEYLSLMQNDTWELVPLPEGQNIVGSKWVLKVKRNADGTVDRFKARLVAQGYTQTQGVDYNEVYAPVARYSAIRSLLALANAHNLEIHQVDVKTAFLNGNLDYDIYMSQPEGFIDKDRPNFVCKLKKSIYGLKQSARCWNSTLDEALISSGYRKSDADGCIYVKSVKNSDGHISFVILAVYVDDIMPVSNDKVMLNAEKASLCKKFDMIDQGEVHYILGMSIKRDRDTKTLYISQQSYLEKVLERFEMENCKPVSTPLEPGRKFQKLSDDEEAFDLKLYQQAIGCLTYASTATRPDIATAVGILSQFMSNPSKQHWVGVKRILRYISGTLNFGLKFSADDKEPLIYGWAGDIETRRSASGYVFQIGNSTISWCSRKQSSVAKSSTEAEYIALSFATQEAIWLLRLLFDFGYGTESSTTIF